MPLAKARDRARKRNERMLKTGIQPTPTQMMEPLSENQRKERLAELIVTPIEPDKVTPSHIISAIDVYNKMTKTYIEQPIQSLQDNRQYQIIIQGGGEGEREKFERLLSGEMPPLKQPQGMAEEGSK